MALPKNKYRLLQVAVDIILYMALCIPYVLVMLKVEPSHRGFYCDDESIRYPYAEDSVSAKALLVTCFALPLVMFIIIEFLTHWSSKRTRWARRASKTSAKLMGLYLFGLTVTMGLTEAGKLTVGRLRPHFIDVCRPNFGKINCTQGYISDALCTNTDASSHRHRESRKSFPSGHASLAFYLALFLGFYVQERVRWGCSVLLRPVLQAGLVLGAVYCSLSRVMDHKHHPGDVAGGALLGLIVAMWMVITLQKTLGYRPFVINNHRTAHQNEYCQDSSESPQFNKLNHRYTSDDEHCLSDKLDAAAL